MPATRDNYHESGYEYSTHTYIHTCVETAPLVPVVPADRMRLPFVVVPKFVFVAVWMVKDGGGFVVDACMMVHAVPCCPTRMILSLEYNELVAMIWIGDEIYLTE